MDRRFRRIVSVATLSIVVVGFLLIALDHFAGMDPSPPLNEQRYLAKMPNVREAASLSAFRHDFENYARDHLGFRRLMIRARTLAFINILGMSRVVAGDMTVYLGADDWMYLGYTLRDHLGVRLSTGQVNWWRETFRDRSEALHARGIPYVFAAAPAKASIFPEHLPGSVRRVPGASAQDQVLGAVEPGQSSDMLDLRPPLRDAKQWHPLYWKGDHHWNSAGAIVAARTIIERIREWFPNEPPLDVSEYSCHEEMTKIGDTSLARGLGVSDRYLEIEHRFRHPDWANVEIEVSSDSATGNTIFQNPARPDGLRVVCIGDSFTFELLRYYRRQFAYVRFVGHFGLDYALQDLLEIVDQSKADLVLEERTEWGLLEVPAGP